MSRKTIEVALTALQTLQVAFLLLHDWVPLGRLTNLEEVRKIDSATKRLLATVLSSLPFALGLAFCLVYGRGWMWPHWVVVYLRCAYAFLLMGAIQAWWLPYLVRSDPVVAARYKERFAGTLRFLPERNGITPDALHVTFHATVVATLVLLVLL